MKNCNECGEDFEEEYLDGNGYCDQCDEENTVGRICLYLAAKQVTEADRKLEGAGK